MPVYDLVVAHDGVRIAAMKAGRCMPEGSALGLDRLGGAPLLLRSIFTAVEDQLGLRLAPAERPVEVLVIDRIERPPS